MKAFISFSGAKSYFLGLATSGVLLFGGLFYFNANKAKAPSSPADKIEFIEAEKIPLAAFNPNALDEKGWSELGFSERQTATILKYRNVVGGNFSSKEQLKKCYAISESKFEELEPYILLPEKSAGSSGFYTRPKYSGTYPSRTFEKAALKPRGKFNPDTYSESDFMALGFSPAQAASIVKYRNYLGGSFQNKQKFKACFVISDENYRKLAPYLLLPETSSTDSETPAPKFKNTKSVTYTKFNPNETDVPGWQQLGFSEKQAQVIVKYRDRNLGGKFSSIEEIQKCFVISPDKFEELRPYIILSSATVKGASEQSAVAKVQQMATDFKSIDLNQITYAQLLEYGFDGKSAAMILNFRKKLGGFVRKQQIVDTYDIDKELAQKLVAEARLDASSVPKYTLVDAPEEWLKSHPYFKYSADKIIYHRITYPDDKKIWNLIRVKPEYQERMKLYLK